MAKHFRENVEPLGYKAFLVAVDREGIYWVIRDALPSDAVTRAKETRDAQLRYPNATSKSSEYRQPKTEFYKLLLRFGIEVARMLAIAHDVLRSVRS